MNNKHIAWHILQSNWHTNGNGHSPSTQLLVKVGESLIHTGELRPCYSGLHASTRLIDALRYAAGDVVTRVECTGPFVSHNEGDKFVCTIRKALWGYNAEEELRLFARLCAKDALGNWQQDVPSVVLKWLETGDPDLRSAARSAAWSAARSARSAARSAAWSAESAAWSAESAAWSAESAQNDRIEKLITDGAIKRGLITIDELKEG